MYIEAIHRQQSYILLYEASLQATQIFIYRCLYLQLVLLIFNDNRSKWIHLLSCLIENKKSIPSHHKWPAPVCSTMGSRETGLTYVWGSIGWHVFIYDMTQHRDCGKAFFPPSFYFCREFERTVTTCSYLRVLEKSRDTSDVQTEASRGASCSVNTGSEERVVLLPRGHTSRAR